MNQLNATSYEISEVVDRLPSIGSLYREVFSSPPWNEAYRCTTCEKSFGKDVGSDYNCCNKPVVDYYPLEETTGRILDQFTRTKARIALATNDESSKRIVGFAWGWEDSLKDEHADHFSFSREEVLMIRNMLGFSDQDTLFYLSELGLHESQRGKGLGKKLYETVLEARDRITSAAILMRTTKKSPAFSIATRNPLFPLNIVHEFGDALDRVVLFS